MIRYQKWLLAGSAACVAVYLAMPPYGGSQETAAIGSPGDPIAGRAGSANRAALEASEKAWGLSPFGTSMPRRESDAVRVARRRASMESNRYSTPPQYYTMGLSQLRTLAKQFDVFALVQLGEQYSSELSALQYDPAFDSSEDPRSLSKNYFTDAIRLGYTHLAAVQAAKSFERGDKVDAYAWQMIAQRFNDPDPGLSRRNDAFATLTAADKAAANKTYLELLSRLELPGS